MSTLRKKDKTHRNAVGRAVSWVTKNIDKLDTVFDILKIIGEDNKEEVVSFKLEATYITAEGKTYTMSLPMSKVKEAGDTANTIASIIVASADDLGATVTEVIKPVVVEDETKKSTKKV
jgi:hypothetical protein